MRRKFSTDLADNLYARLCAGLFRKVLARFPADGRDRAPVNRRDTVTALEQALLLRAQRVARQKLWMKVGAVSAAATVVLASAWIWSRHGGGGLRADARSGRADRALMVLGTRLTESAAGAVVVGEGAGATRRPLTNGMTLEPGTGLVAPATTEVRIGTADGTVLTLERSGELTVVEQHDVQRFSLKQGAVRAQVAKLQGRERFVIATADAEVEVHGTVFRIAVVPPDQACGAGGRTRVSVFEGVVSVRSAAGESFIAAGGQWPAGCPEPGNVAATSPEAKLSDNPSNRTSDDHVRRVSSGISARAFSGSASGAGRMSSGQRASLSVRAPAPVSAAPSGSALAAQNDLFLEAIRARRDQRDDESIRLFSRLINTYPGGPLEEAAMAQRMKVLRSGDRAAAARAGAQYLARFPEGFARAEAQQLAGQRP